MEKIRAFLILFMGFSRCSQPREQILNDLSELPKPQGNPSELFYVESEGFLIENQQ